MSDRPPASDTPSDEPCAACADSAANGANPTGAASPPSSANEPATGGGTGDGGADDGGEGGRVASPPAAAEGNAEPASGDGDDASAPSRPAASLPAEPAPPAADLGAGHDAGGDEAHPAGRDDAANGMVDTAAPVAAPAGMQPPGAESLVPAAPSAPAPVGEAELRIAEALVFSSATPVLPRAMAQVLPVESDVDAVIAALRARYAGRGVELVDAGGGLQFRTALDVAPALRKVIQVPRRLPRVAMEVLAIVAYHQPVSRPEIERLRGTSLSQQTLDALLEANLIAPQGRRETPGRPTVWGTTPHFLAQFGLQSLRDLPRREDLLLEPPRPSGAEAAPEADAAAVPQGDASC